MVTHNAYLTAMIEPKLSVWVKSRSDWPQIGKNPGLFQYYNFVWKRPWFVTFSANLTHFGPNSDIRSLTTMHLSLAAHPLCLHGHHLANGLTTPQLPANAAVRHSQRQHGHEEVQDHQHQAVPAEHTEHTAEVIRCGSLKWMLNWSKVCQIDAKWVKSGTF